ncbi:MAG: 3-dehydroquinate synthase [Thermomicrobiales bacterium]|nr:3-dehydroquinate synthase [Thermomicrobiales bacterium]MCO5222638.1 3-dehydroquinate synthase [Thermomicrobiales bacterium]
MSAYRRIALIGFSGTGKTTTSRILADRLGWDVLDLDTLLEEEYGKTIPEIFAEDGEAAFRGSERQQLQRALTTGNVVISTGGGASATDEVWSVDLLAGPETLTVTLDAAPETIHARLTAQQIREGNAVVRPMLAGDDPIGRIRALREQRVPFYDRSDVTLPVDRRAAIDVAHDIHSLLEAHADPIPAVHLEAASGSSSIYIQPGIRYHAGTLLRERWPKASTVWIVSDEHVDAAHGDQVSGILEDAGLTVHRAVVAPGETSKGLAGAGQLYDLMLDGHIERSDLVLALGGGVVGDLAGFVAATVLRGVGFVQMPTSLLAMVDSSVGGKTGINHSAGKNLIGAFYQPPLVLIDPDFLTTLPPRELRQGWAEVVKHSFIQPSTPSGEIADLEDFLIRNRQALLGLRHPATTYALRRNVALKSRVVEADERESGVRAYLNFGHTAGHAIEAAGYRHMHGEAVAIGMTAASRLSVLEGRIGATRADSIAKLIASYGLPVSGEFELDRVIELIGSDKKRVAGKTSWVLLDTHGGVSISRDVSPPHVRQAIESVRIQ